jgi:hypothetical protein
MIMSELPFVVHTPFLAIGHLNEDLIVPAAMAAHISLGKVCILVIQSAIRMSGSEFR